MTDSAWFALLVPYLRDTLDLRRHLVGAMLAIGAVGGLAGGLVAARSGCAGPLWARSGLETCRVCELHEEAIPYL